jgi:hypothetical protein
LAHFDWIWLNLAEFGFGLDFPWVRLDRDLEHVRRDEVLELLDHRPAASFGPLAADQHRERVDRLAIPVGKRLVAAAVESLRLRLRGS